MNFKDILKQDIKNTFLNNMEFADTHIINGKAVNAVLDDEILKENGILNNDELIIYVSSDEIGIPSPNSILTLDGKNYIVVSASTTDDMREIHIKRARGR